MDLYVKETGSKNAETIIFLHAGAMAGWMWDDQLKSFRDYHCIVPDLPEHGQSNEVKPFTIKNTAEIIMEIINKRALNGKANLVGISLGAQIIVQILSKAPQLVNRAFISGTLINTVPNSKTLLNLLDHTINEYAPVKDNDFFIKANMRTYNMPKDFFKEFKESTLLLKRDSLERILTENMLFKLPDGLEKVEAPILIMTGEKDYKIIKKSANDLLMSLPGSVGYMAPNVGHAWNLEDSKLFNLVLRRWISNGALKDALLPMEF
jgi:pimeloyl-ACP methyl ester carboxylesterase